MWLRFRAFATDGSVVIFIELPKYKVAATPPPKNLDKWILFFKSLNDQVLETALIQTLKKLVQKRFPSLSAASIAKIETLTTAQLEAEFEKVLDYASLEEFEAAIRALQ